MMFWYLDIPHFYMKTPHGKSFMQALAETEDISIFARPSV